MYIFPLKADKKTFDANKEELGFASKPKPAKKVKTAAELEEERLKKLKEEEEQIKGKIVIPKLRFRIGGPQRKHQRTRLPKN